MRSRPVRNQLITWERNEQGEVVITIPRQAGWKVRLLTLLFHIPKKKVISLDEIGSEVWVMCDGKNSVERILRSFGQRHKLNPKEAEVSLLSYLRTLGRKQVIGFAVDTDGLSRKTGEGKGS